MLRSDELRNAIVLCVVAVWVSLAGTSFADSLEDARTASPPEDRRSDQAVQHALVTPSVKPPSPSLHVGSPQPAFNPVHHPLLVQASSRAQRTIPSSWNAALHGPPLPHRFKLFQLLSVYRL